MNEETKVAVCSRSFSRNPVLRAELLQRYSNVKFNDSGIKFDDDSLVDFLSDCDKAIVALEKVNSSVLEKLPGLKVISKYGVGLDMIDFQAMSNHGKMLAWKGGVNRRSVSELVISYAIALLRYVPESHKHVLDGGWKQFVGRYLSGSVVGIVGCGFIGKDLVQLLKPFGCKILANDIVDYADFYAEHNVTPVSLDELLIESDVVTLHVPLDDSTRNVLSADKLALMKNDAVLINAARGGLVDENALKTMLKERSIAGAALDVFDAEPPTDVELLNMPNFIVTPHIGGSADEAILAMGRAAIAGLDEPEDPLSFA